MDLNKAQLSGIVSLAMVLTGVVNQSEYVSKPSWLTGNMTLGIYTSGGNGAADFIFKEVALYHKP